MHTYALSSCYLVDERAFLLLLHQSTHVAQPPGCAAFQSLANQVVPRKMHTYALSSCYLVDERAFLLLLHQSTHVAQPPGCAAFFYFIFLFPLCPLCIGRNILIHLFFIRIARKTRWRYAVSVVHLRSF